MQKYDYAEQVKNKLIKLLSMNPECKRILDYCKNSCTYELSKEATLKRINFNWYDSIICFNDGAGIVPEYGSSKVVLSYNSFDELLNIIIE